MGEQQRRIGLGLVQKGQPGPQKMQIDIKNTSPIVCGLCGCKVFTPAIQLHHVSAIASPTGQELTIQQQVLVCFDCREVKEV